MNRALVLRDIQAEYLLAVQRFPKFNSTHEGYAILKEEVDELWDAVKSNDNAQAVQEAYQVAAMALRFIIDCGGDQIRKLT